MDLGKRAIAADASMRLEIEQLRRRLDVLYTQLLGESSTEPLPEGEFAVLECRVGGDRMAVLLSSAEEVVHMALLTSAVEAGPHVLGMLNLRGDMIPVLDVQARIRGVSPRPDVGDMIIICRDGGGRVGLAVQQVFQVFTARKDEIQSVDRTIQPAPYLLGVLCREDRSILVLSVRRLVSGCELPDEQEPKVETSEESWDIDEDALSAVSASAPGGAGR